MQMVHHMGETSHFINFKSSVFKIKKMKKLADDLPSTNNARKCLVSLATEVIYFIADIT